MSDVRSLLKAKRAETRISHPYATYTSSGPSGQLKCTICNSIVKLASAWEGHLGSKAHRTNLARLREEEASRARQAEEERARGAAARKAQEESERRSREEEELTVQAQQMQIQTGSKRKVEDTTMGSPPSAKGKKAKLDSQESSPSAKAGFPADFFSDPNRQIPVHSNSDDDEDDEGGEAMAVDAPGKSAIDEEYERFQRELLAETSTKPKDKAELYAQATVAAEPEMFTEEQMSGFAGQSVVSATTAEVLPLTEEESAELKRKQREAEERELIMDRLLEEERIQEEADMRVAAMKRRMEALKKKREARKGPKPVS